jgi:hypothetical protein
MGDMEEIKPIESAKVDEFIAMSEDDKIATLQAKFESYPEFVRMTENEKTAVLVGDYIDRMEQEALVERQAQFLRDKSAALEAQRVSGLDEIELVRVRVYKERLALEQRWADAESAGTWEIPK